MQIIKVIAENYPVRKNALPMINPAGINKIHPVNYQNQKERKRVRPAAFVAIEVVYFTEKSFSSHLVK
jgi:hypothetical protein